MSMINDKNTHIVGIPTSEDFHIWSTHYYKGSDNPKGHYEYWSRGEFTYFDGIHLPLLHPKTRNQIIKGGDRKE